MNLVADRFSVFCPSSVFGYAGWVLWELWCNISGGVMHRLAQTLLHGLASAVRCLPCTVSRSFVSNPEITVAYTMCDFRHSCVWPVV